MESSGPAVSPILDLPLDPPPGNVHSEEEERKICEGQCAEIVARAS